MFSVPKTLLALSSLVLVAQDPGLDALREEGRWKQLRPRIEGWYRAKPEDPYALLWMSRLKQAFGDPEAALELARKAAALKGADSLIQAQLGMAAGETAGRTEGKLKQFSLAREMKKALETALAAQPGDVEASRVLFQFYVQAPSIVGGGEGKARELAQRLARLKPVAGLLLQANLAFQGKDLEAGRGFIQQALAVDGKSYEAHLFMASYQLRQKPQALDAAVASYRQALAANPRGIQAHAQIAAILAEQGKLAEMEACLAQARKLVPENLFPFYAAAQNLIAENKYLERVEPMLRTYLGQEPEGGMPDWAAAHYRLGLLFEKQGRRAEALQELDLALRLRPAFKAAKQESERLRKG